MEFREADASELDAVVRLYRMASNTPYSVWNDRYPSKFEALQDLKYHGLFVLTEDSNVIGCLSIVPEHEMDAFTQWELSASTCCEIARIAIKPSFQGKRLAKHLVSSVFPVLKVRGYSSIRLSVAKINIPACKTYLSLGFQIRGEAYMYGSDYYLMEKAIV